MAWEDALGALTAGKDRISLEEIKAALDEYEKIFVRVQMDRMELDRVSVNVERAKEDLATREKALAERISEVEKRLADVVARENDLSSKHNHLLSIIHSLGAASISLQVEVNKASNSLRGFIW